MKELIVKIKYHLPELLPVNYTGAQSDWIDLRAAETVHLSAGEHRYISLGISVCLPSGYEMWIAPRSSTFKNFGILVPNSPAVIDESFCGDEDVLRLSVLAVRDTVIHLNDRICQCRLVEHQPRIVFEPAESLGNPSRGGLGSTGIV